MALVIEDAPFHQLLVSPDFLLGSLVINENGA